MSFNFLQIRFSQDNLELPFRVWVDAAAFLANKIVNTMCSGYHPFFVK